jgi:hypothetical protein
MCLDLSDIKRREEQKREAALGPTERWRLIMEAITWAERQPQVQRNTPARCLQLQRAHWAEAAGCKPSTGDAT